MDNVIFMESITQPKGIFNHLSLMTLVIIVVGLIVLFFGIFYSMRNTNLSLTDKEVIIKSMFYGRKIPLENILIDEIKSINLTENVEYKISIRTNGIGLPGFRLGWMRLKNGQKALVYLTDVNNVLLLPTKDFVVLFSMNNIEEFIGKISRIKNSM